MRAGRRGDLGSVDAAGTRRNEAGGYRAGNALRPWHGPELGRGVFRSQSSPHRVADVSVRTQAILAPTASGQGARSGPSRRDAPVARSESPDASSGRDDLSTDDQRRRATISPRSLPVRRPGDASRRVHRAGALGSRRPRTRAERRLRHPGAHDPGTARLARIVEAYASHVGVNGCGQRRCRRDLQQRCRCRRQCVDAACHRVLPARVLRAGTGDVRRVAR